MVNNIKWDHLVPKQVLDIIERINGVERMKKISNFTHQHGI